jgi:hypothetical protein
MLCIALKLKKTTILYYQDVWGDVSIVMQTQKNGHFPLAGEVLKKLRHVNTIVLLSEASQDLAEREMFEVSHDNL